MRLKIGNKYVGDGEPTYIVLEIARTYNNDIKTAEKMIRIAAAAGADAVKIQSIEADKLMVCNEDTKEHLKLLRGLERSLEDHEHLAGICRDNGIEFLSAPESLDMVDLLERIGVEAFKIASLNLVYHDLLRHVASKKKPIILSTGMGTVDEIENAVDVIKSTGNDKIILMHCVSLYPTEPDKANLNVIKTLKNRFNLVTGYSDHTIGIVAPLCAVALGADVVEKHFTLDRNQGGADHVVSVDPKQLDIMIKNIRLAEKMLGSGIKELSKEEYEIARLKRRKLVTAIDMVKGTEIKKDMITCKQLKKSSGIEPQFMEIVIGKKLKSDLKRGEPITWDNIA